MTNIKVKLGGIERGPFSEEMVRLYLDHQVVLPTDLAQLGEDAEWRPVTEVLEHLAQSRPTERFIRKKKKTSSAKQRARQKKILIWTAYLTVALLLVLAFIFQDFVANVYDFFNYTLFQQWVRYLE